MTLSIIITYYKGENFIIRLLESIKNSYIRSKQKISLEVILVVDSPDENIVRISRVLDDIFLSQKNISAYIIKNKKNLGVDKSRDIGIRCAKYEWFTVFDQDDFMSDNYFIELERNKEKKEVLFYFFNGYILNTVSNKKIPVYYFMPKITLKKIIGNNIILSPSFLVFNRSHVINNHIGFTLPFQEEKGSDDWFFMLQLLQLNPNPFYKVINKKLINYCIHETNYSHRVEEIVNGSIKILDTLEIKEKNLKKRINRKKRALEYSKKVYFLNKQEISTSIVAETFNFFYLFLSDTNRVFRFLHRKLIGLEIRN